MFSCQGLRAIRGERLLFDHLGFSLKSGSTLVLRGANGSGKTSLLRILAGLLPAAAGKVTWNGNPAHNTPEFLSSMQYIGHNNALKPELSIYDNIQYWAALRGTEMLVPAAMEFFGLWGMMDIPAGQLSAGWQRRVALARLLAIPCPLWLLDEPTANLDSEGIEMLEGLIRTRSRQNGIVILSSHGFTEMQAGSELHLEDFQGFFSEDLFADAD